VGQFIQDLKIDVLQAIKFIIQSWNEITTETIYNCWNHTKILHNTEHLDDIEADDDIEAGDFVLDEISRMLEILNLPNFMGAEEFLNIPDDNIIYEVPEDVTGFIEMFKKRSDGNTDDLDEMDDSIEVVAVSTNVALQSLNTIHTFLLQQENSNEYIKLVNSFEKFIRSKQTQTTINQYFS